MEISKEEKKENNSLITVAQVGVGYWGPNLLRNLAANRRCKVKTVVEILPERQEYVKRLYPAIEVTEKLQKVLDDSFIDAVVIATPVETHFEMAMQSIKAEKHILVEKPMATTVTQVEEIGELATKNNKVAMSGHTFLFNAAVRYLKQLIDRGEIGEVRYLYSQRLNLGRIRSDVDALWNFAPHDVSIIQYLLENPTPDSVTRYGMDYVQPGIEDVVFLNIIYPGKVIANIHVSWLDPLKVRSLTAVGSKKMVIYDDLTENKIAIYDKGIDLMAVLGENMDYDHPSQWKFNYRSGDVLLPKIDFKEPLKVEIDHFIDCIQDGIPCLTGIDHTLEVVRILSSCNQQNI